MAKTVVNEYVPNRVTPPGETLAETLEVLGMSQVDLADRIGKTSKAINQIIKDKVGITSDTAIRLERATGVPASFWNNRQRRYDEHLSQLKERQVLERQIKWLSNFPYSRMVNFGWIQDVRDKVGRLQQILNFFGVASPEAWDEYWNSVSAYYRQSQRIEPDKYALAAWLRKGELLAQDMKCSPFDADNFRSTLKEIRSLTRETPNIFLPQLRDRCASCGVAVVLVRELPKTASGATRWLSSEKALLQLSLRYHSDDNLWFSFFHEAAHILLHRKRIIFIEGKDETGLEEDEANWFATDLLIPNGKLEEFTRRNLSISKISIRRFADEIGIAPGIVVGQLQKKGLLPYSHCNDLKRGLSWA